MRITLGFRSYKQLHFISFLDLPFCISMNKHEFMTALSELSNNILDKVDEKLESLKRGLSEDQETCADQIVKKVKSQTKSVWKKKSNEVQHSFNEAVNDKVEGALSALAKNKLDKVKSELEEGQQIGTCFACGLQGHYRAECPNWSFREGPGNSKSSTNDKPRQ